MANQKISVEYFAADEHFQQWVHSPTPESDQYWKNWIDEHPEHKGAVSQAKQLLLSLRPTSEIAPNALQQEVWAKMKPAIDDHYPVAAKSWTLKTKVSIAASLSALFVASILFFGYYFSTNTSYHTAYGETKDIVLPDGSTVMLNANSSIRFTEDWESNETREVWLEGEAFFDVRQITLSADSSSSVRLPFVVHSENMDVEVLGTTFNVKDRQAYSEVVLNTGKVSVTPQLDQQIAPIAMNPGDRLAYSANEREWKIHQIDPEIPTAWRHQELVFDEMPLGEIALLLEDAYGYEIRFETAEIESYVFTGNIKTNEVEMLMPMLERSFGLKVQQDGQKISLSKK